MNEERRKTHPQIKSLVTRLSDFRRREEKSLDPGTQSCFKVEITSLAEVDFRKAVSLEDPETLSHSLSTETAGCEVEVRQVLAKLNELTMRFMILSHGTSTFHNSQAARTT